MRIFFILATLACSFAAENKKPQLPAPYATPVVANPPKVVPQPDGRQLTVPAGFTVTEFASGFTKPRIMLQLPGGAVLVTESIANGSIVALTDNGKTRKPLITGLARPFGMTFHDGYLYVSEDEAIKRYKVDEKALTAGAGESLVSLKGYTKGHWTRSIAIDSKAGKLYVSVGSGSNVDTGDPDNRAAVNVYNMDGSSPEIFATGLRNPVSIKFNPASKQLWTTVQERDGLGDDLVPDFFTSVKKGAFYGWPYAYIGPNEEPRHKGEAPEKVAKTVVPDVVLPAHVAAMDFTFYTGKLFPDSGWMMDAGQKEVWGRPVGVAQMNDGSLLVSEDGNNKIWHISYKK
ncbi:MAG: PQQ-dependent sugar dehydrogenase [Acidobacteria bacterium]|nr:PQQ-dependent sugar dehydrogenase [Acidobacteriota bacterium]